MNPRRDASEPIDYRLLWRFLKCYCVSINKVLARALCFETEKFREIQCLFQALNRALLAWTTEISKNGENVSKRNIELYFQALLETSVNKAWFCNRTRSYEQAHETLDSVYQIYANLRQSKNPDSQHVCAVYLLARGAIFLDNYNYESALKKHLAGLKCLIAELKIRFGQGLKLLHTIPSKTLYKMRRNVFVLDC